MQPVTRILKAFIAFAIISVLANCNKDSELDFSDPTSTSYTGDGSSSGRNSLTNQSVYRLLLNSTIVTSTPAMCGTTNAKNFLKNSVSYGQVTVGNDATDYYITISGVSGWVLKEIRLYAGEEENIPVNPGNGAPQVGQYPINEVFASPYVPSWTIKIPTVDMGADFWVSSRVTFINGTGATQTIWSEGNLFNPVSTASKFECELQECIIDEGCAYGQGHWFGNGNLSWPDVNGATDGDITIGSENYTRDEARAIWWANNGNCPGIPDAKQAFAFVASIKLSGASVIGNASLWNDIATVENWLTSLDRLTDLNICNHPDAPAAVKDAIARIGDWIDGHGC